VDARPAAGAVLSSSSNVRTIDRYLIRQILPPFFLALSVCTFVLLMGPMLEKAELLLSKGVPIPTVGFLLLTLVPQGLGVAIPIATLAGILIGLGRMSADRETVALLACGVSPVRLLRPVLMFAAAVAAVDLFVMTSLIADANQTFREITFKLMGEQTEADIKPRVFYEGFPGKVLFVWDTVPGGGWSGVFLADTSHAGRPTVVTADAARLVLNQKRREVDLYFPTAQQYVPGTDQRVYDTSNRADLRVSVPAEQVFGNGEAVLSRGLAEKRIPQLKADIVEKRKRGESPHNEIMFIHQMFAFPVACLTFGLLGLSLGLHTRREGKLAGLTLGLAVVFVYYGLHMFGEAGAKGHVVPAEWARWIPNLVLVPAGLLLVRWRTRSAGVGLRMPAWLSRMVSRRPVDPATGQSPDRVVVVIRFPHLGLPRPRLLDLYVGTRYLRMVALSLTGLLGLYYIGTCVELAEKLFKGQADGRMLALYLWYSTPRIINDITPIATLVAVLGTIGALTRTSELTVMRACGVSLYRTALPLILLAFVGSGLLFALEERVLAHSSRKAEALEDVIRGRPPRTFDVRNRNWQANKHGAIYYYENFDSRSETLNGLSIFELKRPPYRMVGHTSATRAVHRNGTWTAENGWMQRFPATAQSSRESFSTRPIALPPISDFRDIQQTESRLANVVELWDYIQRMSASGVNLAEQRVNLHRKLAFPLVTLVMTLLAIPFGVTTGKKGAMYGIGLAIVLAFGYFFLTAFFLAVGTTAVLPAPLAAWAPNILFLAGAVYLMLTVRT
jgi:LPS export ABC transporter permease LptG/LPS export ABC transporter permease LptF